MKGKIDTAVNIPAKGKVVLNLPAEVSLKEMGETVFQMITKPKEVDYSFNMDTKLISDDNTLKDSQIRMEGKGKLKELTKKDK